MITYKTMRKNLILIMLSVVFCDYTFAQDNESSNVEEKNIYNFVLPDAKNNTEELKIMYINKGVSTHFLAMEDIKYVDISTPDIVGDIPVSNALRIKPIQEDASGVVTIVTERYFVQYMLVYTSELSKAYTRFNIPYSDLRSFMNPEQNLTKAEMYDYAHRMYVSNNKFFDVSSSTKLLRMTLNNIYTIDKYFFIDISLFNKSNIQFNTDQIRFKIEDKRQTKATNFQSVEVLPLMEAYKAKTFKKKYRNIFVFEKFTFPEEKVFTIEISEKQISGRTIILRINYSDVLNADAFVN